MQVGIAWSKPGITVGVDKRADLVESFGCFSLSSLEFDDPGSLLVLRLLLHSNALFDRTEALPVAVSRPWMALSDGHGGAHDVPGDRRAVPGSG